jgi:hypothetical protein
VSVPIVAVGTIVLSIALSACSSKPASRVTGLPTKQLEAGSITITVVPQRFDSKQARFEIQLDTHSGSLDEDLARTSKLMVGETRWSAPTWSGDGSGGHHRSGTLTFTANGPPTGTVVLQLTAFGEDNTARWTR